MFFKTRIIFGKDPCHVHDDANMANACYINEIFYITNNYLSSCSSALIGFFIMLEFWFVFIIMYREKDMTMPELYFLAQNADSNCP